MRGQKTISLLHVVAAGHALMQNLRRRHCELTVDFRTNDRIRVAFAELAHCI